MSQDNGSEEEFEVTFGTPTLKDWKQYFRHIQKVPLNMREPTPESSEESSFELDESFEAYLNRKRTEIQSRKAEATALAEQLLQSHDETMDTVKEMNASRTYCNDSTIVEADSISKISDTSFEEMERMCSIRSIVDRTGPERNDETNETMGLDDMTQLADVEEPSGLWEHTVLPGGNTVASPIKRMHVIRPSTIIEEATINETATSKNTSAESFVTAKQSQREERDTDNYSAVTGSEVYRTAEEMSETEPSIVSTSVVAYDQTTMGDDESSYGKNSTREADSTCDDNDRDRDHGECNETGPVDSTFKDDPEDKASHWETVTIEEDEESLLEFSLLQDDDEVAAEEEVAEQDETSEEQEQPGEESQPMSPMLDAIPDHFNDTMEEIQFMMKQGLKLKAIKQQQKELESSSATTRKQPNADLGVAAYKGTPTTPFSPNHYLKPKQNAAASNSCKQMLFGSTGKANNMPPGPSSTGSFKKPLSRLPILKSAKKYDHIVSPIGAYIKKTPQNTLQSKIHCPSQNLIDVLSNKSVRESRTSVKENYSQETIDASSYISSIPRKGVISSSRAHVLDERSTVRIPGGEKVRKLLTNSPTMVIRHEGRLRYVDESHGSKATRATLGDDSLADLSTISGDISVRVLKDAKRF